MTQTDLENIASILFEVKNMKSYISGKHAAHKIILCDYRVNPNGFDADINAYDINFHDDLRYTANMHLSFFIGSVYIRDFISMEEGAGNARKMLEYLSYVISYLNEKQHYSISRINGFLSYTDKDKEEKQNWNKSAHLYSTFIYKGNKCQTYFYPNDIEVEADTFNKNIEEYKQKCTNVDFSIYL